MNTTNENNNFENETIETTSNELETQDTYGSETTTETNVINSPNKNYKVRANYYNYVFNDSDNNDPNNHRRLDNAPIDVVVDPEETGKYINVTSGDMSAWVPCVSIEYSGNLYDDNGNTTGDINLDESFDCTFKAEVPFLNNGGYNGCINFTWTNKSLGQNSIPENCIASDYDVAYNEANPENSYGLFDSVLNSTDMNGFSVTFFPSNVYEHDGGYYTTQLSRYVLSYKTVSLEGDCTENLVKHKAGNLPQNVNIFDFGGDNAVNTKIYVEHSSDKYNFYLNGILFASVQDIFVDMEKWGNNDGYFTASILTIPYVAANLQIIDIGSYSLNLTQTEKTNIGNLGVNILNYYVDNEGIEEKDYTEAFRTALTNHRRVYVPGGTYRITGELEIGDNCELELAQDAVLDFQPVYYKKTIDAQTGEITVNRDEPAIFEELEDDPSDFRCITLNMLSSLIGNHATIRVPYNFKGSVIYASTRSHPNSNSINSVTPFDRWDPQWKPARYLKDINIVKPIEQNSAGNVSTGLVGRHSSLNGETNGTAVFIEGHRNTLNTGSTYIWGLDYSGLRIGGAFKYGIYGKNNCIKVDDTGNPDPTGTKEKWSWTYDMRINAFIDCCKVGVYLDHCSNARISAVIQPRAAEIAGALKYAEYGIYLDSCTNVDLSGSRVWDWNDTNTKWAFGNDNQHLRLVGNCKGLILDDSIYYSEESYDLRDLIKSDNDDDFNNFDNMTILQEPVSKFFSFEKESEGDEFVNTTYLKDGVYIKAEYIEDLEEIVRAILNE